MYDIIRIFFTGMLISFLGTLPLGTLNVSAMQLSIQETTRRAIQFALGVAVVEIIYVRVSLKGMNWVMEHQSLFRILEWVTVLLFVILAISSFRAAQRKEGDQKNIVFRNNMNRFVLGVTMSAINPVQIPFWFIWSTYLLSNGFLLPKEVQYNTYTAGIGIGTLIALAVFIFAGKWMIQRLRASHRIINLAVGSVFVLSALIQLYRMLK